MGATALCMLITCLQEKQRAFDPMTRKAMDTPPYIDAAILCPFGSPARVHAQTR
jgi:hypothetical protein